MQLIVTDPDMFFNLSHHICHLLGAWEVILLFSFIVYVCVRGGGE